MTKPKLIRRLIRLSKDLTGERERLLSRLGSKGEYSYLKEEFRRVCNLEGQLEVIELVLKLYKE